MEFTERKQANEFYASFLKEREGGGEKVLYAAMAELGRRDLFFLLTNLLRRKDADKDWLFQRCREVQLKPNGCLDLWAREHYKSTIITFAKSIQDILNDPEITIGIFSITRPNAKKFLSQIREELIGNTLLKKLYPEILWDDPQKEAPKWSLDDGIIVKRKGNPQESTVEAHGLVEGMPTGRHFKLRVYDDVIDETHVTNPDMIKKAIKAWELSLNLGSTQPLKCYNEIDLERYVGTRYHFNDPYAEIIKRKAAHIRIHPGTENGQMDGEPVLWDREFIAKKRRKMGPYVFGCQILQNPVADKAQGFREDWLKRSKSISAANLNLYLICDPASSKKKGSDYTVFWVIGLGADRNYYLIDGIRDRLSLTERANKLFYLYKKYMPLGVGYEKYGIQADIEHYQDRMERENFRFTIIELDGSMPKNDRIRRLIPLFEGGRIYIPNRLIYIDIEDRPVDLIKDFVDEEYKAFPVSTHDDMLDCMARIVDTKLNAQFPIKKIQSNKIPGQGIGGSWQSL